MNKVSTHVHTTFSEVETQIQQYAVEENGEIFLEPHPLVDYQLERDKYRDNIKNLRGFKYEFTFSYASYEEPADRDLNTYEEAMKGKQLMVWMKVMKNETLQLSIDVKNSPQI